MPVPFLDEPKRRLYRDGLDDEPRWQRQSALNHSASGFFLSEDPSTTTHVPHSRNRSVMRVP